MIVLRHVVKGVKSHFPLRATEWIMVFPALGMWLAFHLDPDMFSVSASYSYLDLWADEDKWALLLGFVGVLRLLALTINGTFEGFQYSPHIRAAASLVGAVVWAQVSLAFMLAWLNAHGALSGAIGWSTLVLLEIVNIYRSWSDVGKEVAERG